jgi:hypothetical protein
VEPLVGLGHGKMIARLDRGLELALAPRDDLEIGIRPQLRRKAGVDPLGEVQRLDGLWCNSLD